MEADHRRLDRVRRRCAEVENHVIDEFRAGRLTRRDFLRRGAVAGLSLSALGTVLAGCGSAGAASSTGSSRVRGKPGATIRAGILVPTGVIDPTTVADQGGHIMLSQTGEYLCLADQQLVLRPVLATSWRPNATEGSTALINMGFTDLGVQRVFAHTMTANAASRRVMEKCGLTLVHTVPYEGPDADVIDGAEQGWVEYALTKPEWETHTDS
jgi:hypothetical protein